MSTATEVRLVGPQELADRLGVSKRHIYRLVASDLLPHYRIGGSLRFNPDQVLAALQENVAS